MPASTATWLDDRHRQALDVYEAAELPKWRRSGFWTTSVDKLDLAALEARRYEPATELPGMVADVLGDDLLSALVVQRGASTVHAFIDPELAAQGVVVTSLEAAVEEYPELVGEWYTRRLSHDEGKFQAANAALWTGGVFIYVPQGLKVEKPIQSVYLIDEPGT